MLITMIVTAIIAYVMMRLAKKNHDVRRFIFGTVGFIALFVSALSMLILLSDIRTIFYNIFL